MRVEVSPAILRRRSIDAMERTIHEIAEAVMQINKHVSTGLRQVSPVSGDLRLRVLSWVGGEKRTETIHKEYGCLFKVDLARCYFSPRLSYERRRISQQVTLGEVVVTLFSGVGCYSILIAKYSGASRVYSIDVNPVASINKIRAEKPFSAALCCACLSAEFMANYGCNARRPG